MPFFLSRKDFLGDAFGGWQISGVYSLESGVPYTVVNGIDADGIGLTPIQAERWVPMPCHFPAAQPAM
ncbi:MAG: hypothetical protein EBY17_04450 [Acidobacteriia bacterium]|nr:hypothetical protein [Terriglobia bacterium]